MKTINLFFDFEFTSLSPDAQPISLGIVSEEINEGFTLIKPPKSFYAEFSDFDINRCDDWVLKNVVSKLSFGGVGLRENENETLSGGDIESNSAALKHWLQQFYDYQIQFVADCSTWDWYWMLQLLGEWEEKPICLGRISLTDHECVVHESKTTHGCPNKKYFEGVDIKKLESFQCNYKHNTKTGLPKLPQNISQVPFDLNDLIAIKKGITPAEAFDLDREEMVKEKLTPKYIQSGKHNALFDADVTKEIYNKLNQ